MEKHREVRFYICLVLGYSLLLIGFFVPPTGVIDNSVLIGSGMFLCIGAMAVGIDIKGTISELRKLKSTKK